MNTHNRLISVITLVMLMTSLVVSTGGMQASNSQETTESIVTVQETTIDPASETPVSAGTTDTQIAPAQYPATSFVSTWNTSISDITSSPSDQMILPLISSGNYDFTVDWGDGTTDTITSYNQVEVTHTYSIEGVYTLVIDGTIEGWRFAGQGDRRKILEISQWGSLRLGNDGRYFEGASNLQLTTTDSLDLTGTTDLSAAFRYCDSLENTGALDSWDVSGVTNMSSMFSGAGSFNQPLSSWDTSAVTKMGAMFLSASAFNQPLDIWDTSSVTTMRRMFESAKSFNQPLGSWDTSSVTDMRSMFMDTWAFNQPINSWDTSSVTTMEYMFTGTRSFNQPLDSWDTSAVTNMAWMFKDSWDFNQPINSWITSSVTDMNWMFARAFSFNQPLDSWDTSSVTNMNSLFQEASSFDQPLGSWDTSSVQGMNHIFRAASSFNQPLDAWNTSAAIGMSYMFKNASSFDQPLDSWNTSSVRFMTQMFYGASSFNQPLGSWNVSSVTDMGYMFYAASSFDQSLGSWDVSSATDMRHMFYWADLSVQNYDDILIQWSQLQLQPDIRMIAYPSQYSGSAAASRDYIIETFNWLIQDAGRDATAPDLTSPTDLVFDEDETGNIISWEVGDRNPWVYNITLNDTPYQADTIWENGTKVIEFDNPRPGTYEYTIYLYDEAGNMVSDSVTVTINSVAADSGDDPSSSNPSDAVPPADQGDEATDGSVSFNPSLLPFSMVLIGVLVRRRQRI